MRLLLPPVVTLLLEAAVKRVERRPATMEERIEAAGALEDRLESAPLDALRSTAPRA